MRLPFLALPLLVSCAERVQFDIDVPENDPSNAWAKAIRKISTNAGIDMDELSKAEADLERYLSWAGEHGQHTSGWKESREDKRIAFLLNVHNAAVLHNILRNGIPESPDDVDVGLYRWDGAGFYWGSKYRVDSEWSAIRHIGFHDAVSRYQEPLLWVALHDGTRDSARLRWWKRRKLQNQLGQEMGVFVNSNRGLKKDQTGWVANPLFIDRMDDFLFWTDAEDICDWMAGYATGERKEWLDSQVGNCTLAARPADRRTDVANPSETNAEN